MCSHRSLDFIQLDLECLDEDVRTGVCREARWLHCAPFHSPPALPRARVDVTFLNEPFSAWRPRWALEMGIWLQWMVEIDISSGPSIGISWMCRILHFHLIARKDDIGF